MWFHIPAAYNNIFRALKDVQVNFGMIKKCKNRYSFKENFSALGGFATGLLTRDSALIDPDGGTTLDPQYLLISPNL